MTTTTEADVRRQLLEMTAERDALAAALEEHVPGDIQFWYWKGLRQRDALDALNRRVVSQRFVLRTLERLGRGLTRDEYRQARNEIANEQLKARIDEPAA